MGARPAGKRPGPAGAGSRRPAKRGGRCAPRADGEHPPASCRRSPRSGPARLRDPPRRLPAVGDPYVLERLARQLQCLADWPDSLDQAQLVELAGQLPVADKGAPLARVVATAPVRPRLWVDDRDPDPGRVRVRVLQAKPGVDVDPYRHGCSSRAWGGVDRGPAHVLLLLPLSAARSWRSSS